MSGTKHPDLLNALVHMQESIVYAARKNVLMMAEMTIVSLEQENAQLKAELAQCQKIQRMSDLNYDALERLLNEKIGALAQAQQREARLRDVISIYKEASYQSHNGHWDRTMQGGLGCPECIRARELRAKAELLEKKEVLERECARSFDTEEDGDE